MAFSALRTLNKLYKLYEAAEENGEPVDATEAVGAIENPEEAEGSEEPSKFVSSENKIEFAKIVFNALFSEPPAEGTIPNELLNVTTNNADNVIKFVTACINLDAPLTLTNQNQPESLPNVLQNA